MSGSLKPFCWFQILTATGEAFGPSTMMAGDGKTARSRTNMKIDMPTRMITDVPNRLIRYALNRRRLLVAKLLADLHQRPLRNCLSAAGHERPPRHVSIAKRPRRRSPRRQEARAGFEVGAADAADARGAQPAAP